MKKVALSLLAFGLIGAMAFADGAPPASVGIGAWGRGFYAPLMSNNSGATTGVTAGTGASWGTNPRIGFTIHGDSQYVGFHASIGVDNNSFSITDDTQMWIKPFDGLELQIGRAFNDTLRGEGSFGSWNWVRPNGVFQGDDTVFKRIGGSIGGDSGPQNAIVSYTTGGLFVFFEQSEYGTGPTLLTTYTDKTNNGGLANASFGVGYTIEGVGTIRAQNVGFADNIGWHGADNPNVGMAQVAFKVTAVQNFYADVGAQFPTNIAGVETSTVSTASQLAGYDYRIPLYANYKADKATIHGGLIYQSNNKYNTTTGANAAYDVALGLDYDLGSGMGFNGDVQFGNKYYSTNSNNDAPLSILAGVTKGFSNGLVDRKSVV